MFLFRASVLRLCSSTCPAWALPSNRETRSRGTAPLAESAQTTREHQNHGHRQGREIGNDDGSLREDLACIPLVVIFIPDLGTVSLHANGCMSLLLWNIGVLEQTVSTIQRGNDDEVVRIIKQTRAATEHDSTDPQGSLSLGNKYTHYEWQ